MPVDELTYSKLAQALIKNDLLFKFANQFRSTHESIEEALKYNVSDDVFNDFKKFISDKEYTYTTQTERDLEKLEKQAKEEKYFSLLEEELTKLKKALESTKQSDLENHQEELKELLEYEIVKRYYF